MCSITSQGGIVIATDKKETKNKVVARYKDDDDPPGEILIWDIKEDEFFNERHPDFLTSCTRYKFTRLKLLL